jgi:hypothetical protein
MKEELSNRLLVSVFVFSLTFISLVWISLFWQ